MTAVPFDAFLESLADLGIATREDPVTKLHYATLVAELRKVRPISAESLVRFVQAFPDSVPVLATCAGLGQEQLLNQMKLRLGTAGWLTMARADPNRLIGMLNDEFDLVSKVSEQLDKKWRFEDILLERHLWSRKQAASAVGQGRDVEDEVEAVIKRVGLPYQMRTQFSGRGLSAPCDLAVPEGGTGALIVVGMKGFNSTGSKLSDAVREIEQMAAVRRPNQFVYCVVDGIGWLSRKADLKRIHDLWASGSIDGMYSLAYMGRFEEDIRQAARQKGLLP